jgi:ribosome modulation factor
MTDDELDFAFNLGCQSRLEGKSIASNPYLDRLARSAFDHGWVDVDLNWSRQVRGRWPVQKLPCITYGETA